MCQIIFLNGCGSSGKTSIARAIQDLSPEPWLRFGIDSLIEMMPESYMAFGKKAAEGYFSFIPGENDRGPTMRVESGPLGKLAFPAMAAIAHILAEHGNNLIIDEVLLEDDMLKKYVEHLKPYSTYFVGVYCDFQTMIEREILRKDRAIGLSNDQLNRVHSGVRAYDLKVDTTSTTPNIIAGQILSFMRSTANPKGFKTMHEIFNK